MAGAALMLAKGKDQLDFNAFSKASFWQLFAVPIVLHSCWDLPIFDNMTPQILFLIGLIIVAWIFILALIKSGMTQVSKMAVSEPEPQPAPIPDAVNR